MLRDRLRTRERHVQMSETELEKRKVHRKCALLLRNVLHGSWRGLFDRG